MWCSKGCHRARSQLTMYAAEIARALGDRRRMAT
jgi:hypothetical protein